MLIWQILVRIVVKRDIPGSPGGWALGLLVLLVFVPVVERVLPDRPVEPDSDVVQEVRPAGAATAVGVDDALPPDDVAWAARPAPTEPTVRLVAGYKPRAHDVHVLEEHLREHHPEGAGIHRRGDEWIVVTPAGEPSGCPFLDDDAPRVASLTGDGWSIGIEEVGSVRKVYANLRRQTVRVKPTRPLSPTESRARTVSFVSGDGTEVARFEAEADGGDFVLRRERPGGETPDFPEGVSLVELAQGSAFATRWTVE